MKKTIARRILVATFIATLVPALLAVFLLFHLLRANDRIIKGHLKAINLSSNDVTDSFKSLIIEKKLRFKYQGESFAQEISKKLNNGEEPKKVLKLYFNKCKDISHISIFKLGSFSIEDNWLSPNSIPIIKYEREHLLKSNNKYLTHIHSSKYFDIRIVFATTLKELKNYKTLAEIYQQNKQIVQIYKGMKKYYFYILIAALIFMALLTYVTTGIILRGIGKRIFSLAHATRNVAEGDLDFQVIPKGDDELTVLAQDFNYMVKELKQISKKNRYYERMGAWQEVARRLAHEIKNPLTPILLAVQQIKEKSPTDDPKYTRLVNMGTTIIKEEIDGLKRLVEAFGNLARLPEKKSEPIELKVLVTNLLDLSSLTWGNKNVELKGEIPQNIIINGDLMLIKRVFINLFENAIDAMNDIGIDDPVKLKISKFKNKYILFSIIDKGPGIDDVNRIFEPYYTTKEKGTGLGLPLARKIILDHGGDIEAENGDKKGLIMKVYLPIES